MKIYYIATSDNLVNFLADVYLLSAEQQESYREEELYNCLQRIYQQQRNEESASINHTNHEETVNSSEGTDSSPAADAEVVSCDWTWDGMMCWPNTAAGSLARLPCPQYHLFYKHEYATKQCMEDGQWFISPAFNATWTDYTKCVSNESGPTLTHTSALNISSHLGVIKTISRTGYGLSIISLITAVILMLHFKRLRCPRNTLHVHLFLSFILRGTMWFIHELFVGGLGLPKDVHVIDGKVVFRNDVTHWECRLIMVLFNYAMSCNYIWIFTEGLYLHNLIFVDIFSESSTVKWYLMLGWCSSLTFMVPWVVVRALFENDLCWNTNRNALFFWIIKTPLVLSVLANFTFFMHIVRELFVKLKASAHTSNSRKYRHRKLAKSTLVLIPLMGVPYMLFLGLPDELNETAELVKLYFEMLFNSFNGVIVATLYCYVNGEVRYELKKAWLGCGADVVCGRDQLESSRRASRSLVSTTGCTYIPQHTPPLLSVPRGGGLMRPCAPDVCTTILETPLTSAGAGSDDDVTWSNAVTSQKTLISNQNSAEDCSAMSHNSDRVEIKFHMDIDRDIEAVEEKPKYSK